MPLPVTFGPLAGPIPTNFLDTNFAAVAAMGVLTCTAAGTNALVLTPYGNQNTPASYASGFRAQFVAGASNTGTVTANVASLGVLPVFKDTTLGPVVLTGGEIIAKCAYQIWYDAALNSGSGGFHLVAASGTGSGGGASGGGAYIFLAEQTASGSALQFTSVITSTYDAYFIDLFGLTPNAVADIQMQVSTNNGTSWVASSYQYALANVNSGNSTLGGNRSNSDSVIQLFPGTSSGAGTSVTAEIFCANVNSASLYKEFLVQVSATLNSDGNLYDQVGAAAWLSTSPVNAIQILVSTGIMSNATARIYAIANTNASSSGGGSTFTTAGVVADTRNFVCSFNTTTKLTITATEAIVKLGPGSSAWLGANLSYTLNFGVNGINGLDTGSIQASKFYGVYFIYNPTTNTFNTLASLNLTTPTTLPSGYTAYALMAVVPTNASSQIVAGYNAFGRTCSFQEINIVTGHATVSSLTSLSVAAAVPSIAKSVSGRMGNTTGVSGGHTVIGVASDANGTGVQSFVVVATVPVAPTSPYGGCAVYTNLQLITSQTIYWAGVVSDSSSTLRLGVTGYTI